MNFKIPQFDQPPPEDTRGRILQAASKLIIAQGYARTTTRAIATEAGVNEVTLFRHFGSKENLFHEMVETYSDLPRMEFAMLAQAGDDYRQAMRQVGRIFMQVMMARSDVIRLILCEASHFPEIRNIMAQNPRRLRQALAAYLQSQMDAGRVRKQTPELCAQAFFGMFFSYGILRHVLEEDPASEKTLEEVVDDFVDIFVNGTICPEGADKGEK